MLLLALGCTPAPGPVPGGASAPTGSTPTGATTVPEVVDDTGTAAPTTTGIPLVDADCSALLPLPLASETLAWVPTSEDFAFDAHGNHLGIQSGTLFRTPYGGPSEPVVPGFSDTMRGTRVLADGTLVAADGVNGALVGIDPDTGGTWIIATNLATPNGIAIGADGLVYLSLSGKIVRIDPADGVVRQVAEIPFHSFNGLTFSPDYSRLYWNEDLGNLWYVDFDEDGEPGEPVLGTTLDVGALSLLDGMTADACGNLYTVEMRGVVWRVPPDFSTAEVVLEVPGFSGIPALNFGSGIGGWDAGTLYVSDFLGKLYAAPAGVPGKWEPYLP